MRKLKKKYFKKATFDCNIFLKMLQSMKISNGYTAVMKREKILLEATVILLLCFLLIPSAFSQTWDNKWFKLKGKAYGYIEDDTGKLIRSRFKGQSYVLFRWDSDNIRYDLRHWVQDNDGQWISFFSTFQQPVGNNEVLWRDIYTRLQKDDNWIWVYAVARVKLRPTRLGTVEHAKFVSMGCESPMGSIDGNNFGGTCKLRGKMIDPLDLPFDPQISK
jgi:hypothetical protein